MYADLIGAQRRALHPALGWEEVACKMLVKLTTGVNFINIFCEASTPTHPQSAERY